MTLLHIFILAAIQGICELLPVSSSAHVIFAEHLMGIDPTTPEMILLLVMLHTGTMFAVIVFFWKSWRSRYFSSKAAFFRFSKEIALATLMTGIVGLTLKEFIERVILSGSDKAEVESIFGNPHLIAANLTAVGILIILSSRRPTTRDSNVIGYKAAAIIGAVQGLCLPLRGFSRSGATISTGLFLGLNKERVEEFSFALAVVVTPPVILRAAHRLVKAREADLAAGADFLHLITPSLIGMGMSFLAGLVALRWLSHWLEHGRWHYFGYYCLFAASVTLLVHG